MKKLKSLLQIKEEKTFFYGTRENTEEGLVNFKLNYTDDINEVRKSLEKFLIENHNFLLSNGVSLSPKAYKKQTIILRGNKTTFEISYEAYKYFKEKLLTILDEIKKKAIEDYGINTDSIIRMSLYTSGVSLKKEKEGKNEKTKIETLYFCCANQLDINLLYDVLEEKLKSNDEIVEVENITAAEYYLICGENKLRITDPNGIIMGIINEYNTSIIKKEKGCTYFKRMKKEDNHE